MIKTLPNPATDLLNRACSCFIALNFWKNLEKQFLEPSNNFECFSAEMTKGTQKWERTHSKTTWRVDDPPRGNFSRLGPDLPATVRELVHVRHLEIQKINNSFVAFISIKWELARHLGLLEYLGPPLPRRRGYGLRERVRVHVAVAGGE